MYDSHPHPHPPAPHTFAVAPFLAIKIEKDLTVKVSSTS